MTPQARHLTLPSDFSHADIDFRTLSGGSSIFYPGCLPNDARLQRIRKALKGLRIATKWERTGGGVRIHIIRHLSAPLPKSPFDLPTRTGGSDV